MQQQQYTIIFVIALVMFSIFRRVRRNIGWQQLKPGQMKTRAVLFLVVGAIFLAQGVIHPISLISEAAGIVLGVILAYYGAALTRFEQRDGRWYYCPNAWMGSIVIAIFFGRLIYRMYEMYAIINMGGQPGGYPQAGGLQGMGGYAGDPWTAGLMLIMFAYYVTYYIIILRRHKEQPGTGQ